MSRSMKKNIISDDFCGSKKLVKKEWNRKIRKNKEISYSDFKLKANKTYNDIYNLNENKKPHQIFMK